MYGMEKLICKIECNNGSYGTGFFCKLIFGEYFLRVLITTNNVLNKNDIEICKKIKFSIDNEKIYYEIFIDEFRKIYINEKYNITIIEIKQNDNLQQISFF